jgi:hypothetical protein
VENRISKFTGLIKSASSMYARKTKLNYLDYDDFVGRGFLTLTICLNKWKKKNKNNEEEFGKYFKTALYHKYQSMLVKAYAKKRTAFLISVDDMELTSAPYRHRKHFDMEIGIKELADYVMSRLKTDLERKIFGVLVDPPEELRLMAVMENRRKMKISAITKSPVIGSNRVKLSNGLVIRYLKGQGFDISDRAYNSCFKKIKCKVQQIVKENGFN